MGDNDLKTNAINVVVEVHVFDSLDSADTKVVVNLIYFDGFLRI